MLIPDTGSTEDGAGVEGIDSVAVIERAEEEFEGVASKGMAFRFRLALTERGNVRDPDGDRDNELDDGGGKNESCVAGIRRMVRDVRALSVRPSSMLTEGAASDGALPFASICDR